MYKIKIFIVKTVHSMGFFNKNAFLQGKKQMKVLSDFIII